MACNRGADRRVGVAGQQGKDIAVEFRAVCQQQRLQFLARCAQFNTPLGCQTWKCQKAEQKYLRIDPVKIAAQARILLQRLSCLCLPSPGCFSGDGYMELEFINHFFALPR